MPELDTSGGNVTYAAVSLAEKLGAREIELYGADFSYPGGLTYARGAYIYPHFAKRQNRLFPLEAQASSFLFRTPLEKAGHGNSWYYETGTLTFYREKLEEKSGAMEASLIPIKGQGAPIALRRNKHQVANALGPRFGKALVGNDDFLLRYRNGIAALPVPGKNAAAYLSSLEHEHDGDSAALFTTMLPAMAAFRLRNPDAGFRELFEEVRAYSLGEIDKVMKAGTIA
jgi:hypothetical protein